MPGNQSGSGLASSPTSLGQGEVIDIEQPAEGGLQQTGMPPAAGIYLQFTRGDTSPPASTSWATGRDQDGLAPTMHNGLPRLVVKRPQIQVENRTHAVSINAARLSSARSA